VNAEMEECSQELPGGFSPPGGLGCKPTMPVSCLWDASGTRTSLEAPLSHNSVKSDHIKDR